MKPKYSIGDTVRIRATGEKVKIVKFGCIRWGYPSWYVQHDNKNIIVWWESSLKPYRPSRTGKFRNAKGQFMSEDKFAKESELNKRESGMCSWCDTWFYDIGKHLVTCSYRKAAQEQREHFSYYDSKTTTTTTGENAAYVPHFTYKDVSDSKQRNYQKILTKLDVLEKKIDELGRKV